MTRPQNSWGARAGKALAAGAIVVGSAALPALAPDVARAADGPAQPWISGYDETCFEGYLIWSLPERTKQTPAYEVNPTKHTDASNFVPHTSAVLGEVVDDASGKNQRIGYQLIKDQGYVGRFPDVSLPDVFVPQGASGPGGER